MCKSEGRQCFWEVPAGLAKQVCGDHIILHEAHCKHSPYNSPATLKSRYPLWLIFRGVDQGSVIRPIQQMGARLNENVDLLVFCFCYICVKCDAAVARPAPSAGLGSVQFLESLLAEWRPFWTRPHTHVVASAQMPLPLGVLSAALEWGAVGRLRAGGACVGAAAKSSERGSGALLLLSETPKAVVKEEFSPSIKRSLFPLPGGQKCQQQWD